MNDSCHDHIFVLRPLISTMELMMTFLLKEGNHNITYQVELYEIDNQLFLTCKHGNFFSSTECMITYFIKYIKSLTCSNFVKFFPSKIAPRDIFLPLKTFLKSAARASKARSLVEKLRTWCLVPLSGIQSHNCSRPWLPHLQTGNHYAFCNRDFVKIKDNKGENTFKS